MMDIPVYSKAGQQVGSINVDEQRLGGELRPALLKQAYVMYHANKRQGTSASKGRGEVEGSTRKLYRQKGTGRARVGNERTGKRVGGGATFAKATKSWRQSMPTKMRRLANRNAILAKLIDQEIKVVADLDFDQPRTRDFASMLGALNIDRSCLLAVDRHDRKNLLLSSRNINTVKPVLASDMTAYDLLSHRYVLIDQKVFEQLIESFNPAEAEVSDAEVAATVEEASE